MTSQQAYSNDVNSFRSGIQDQILQHKEKISAVNSALSAKQQKAFEHAKKISDLSTKLIDSGFGGAGSSTMLGGAARKGINKFKEITQKRFDEVKEGTQKIRQRVQDKADQLKDYTKARGQDIQNKVSNVKDQAEQKVSDAQDQMQSKASDAQDQMQSKAQDAQDQVQSKAQDAQADVETKTNGDYETSARQSLGGNTDEVTQATSKGGEVEMQDFSKPQAPDLPEIKPMRSFQKLTSNLENSGGSGLRDSTYDRPMDTTRDLNPDVESNLSTGGESKVADVDPVELDVPTPSSAVVDQAASDARNIGSSVAKNLGGDAGEIALDTGAEVGTEVGLETAAASTSFLAWLGIPEILAAAGAIAGIASAGTGIADIVKSQNEDTTASKMQTKATPSTLQLGGTYVNPVQSSIY